MEESRMKRPILVASLVTVGLAYGGPPGRTDGDDPRRQLDFWLGEWDVFLSEGPKAGENVITLEQGGFAVVERWQSERGASGMSVNYYEPAAGCCKQHWVSSRGGVIEMRGEFVDGAMRFAGVSIDAEGRSKRTRTTLTPMPGGRVRQFIETSTDEGATWDVAFDATYVRKGAGEDQ